MITSLIARARSLWRGVRRRSAVEVEMAEEFRLHLELRAEDLVRSGLSPAEATRRARLEFGCVDSHMEAGVASRGLRPFDELRFSWLDVKLGIRMLVRYPGLTLVGGLAFAFAIWVGAGTFEFVSQVMYPKLPLPDGDRIVSIQVWDVARGRQQSRVLHDFAAWRKELRSVEELGAFRTLRRNLITADGSAEPVELAEITASAFPLTRVRPLLGRALVEADERPDAAPAALIGYRVWQTRFAGDPNIVGRVVRLGGGQTTIVGVMPEGFGFPVSQEVWVPLRHRASEYAHGEGPDVQLFGRLATGFTLEEARTELMTRGLRAAADFPETHEHLRPRIVPYGTLDISGTEKLLIGSSNVFLVMLLVLICGNVALLMFARAATRESELAVRGALGASRSRIITQLFAEALVLGGVAAVIGLLGVSSGLRWGVRVVEAEFLHGGRLPFWFHDSLTPTTVLYAALLTVLGAAIAGVVPALKVTRGLQSRLRQVGTGGGGGLRFGGIWTAVIISQVAVTVAFPVTAVLVRRDVEQLRSIDVGSPSEEYLSARLDMDREMPEGTPLDTSREAFLTRFGARHQELTRRLTTEPGVGGVTFADRLPYMYHPHRLIEVDAGGAAPIDPRWPAGYRVSSASVDPGYFDVLRTPILAGRGFHVGEAGPDVDPERASSTRAGVVIVNQSFVKLVLGGRNPIGRRIRYTHFEQWSDRRSPDGKPGPWYEIVGVVSDLGMSTNDDPKVAGLYHPMAVGAAAPVHLAIHVRGDPMGLAPRLRTLALEVDPTLRVDRVMRMDRISEAELQFLDFWFRLTVLVSCIAVILSLAGIYSVMSFTVARRTREIGVRIALGASARRVVAAIFARPIKQVAIGIGAGWMLVALFLLGAWGGRVPATWVALLVAYAAFMMMVCMLACIVPTLRALRVQPTEALRADG